MPHICRSVSFGRGASWRIAVGEHDSLIFDNRNPYDGEYYRAHRIRRNNYSTGEEYCAIGQKSNHIQGNMGDSTVGAYVIGNSKITVKDNDLVIFADEAEVFRVISLFNGPDSTRGMTESRVQSLALGDGCWTVSMNFDEEELQFKYNNSVRKALPDLY